MNGYELVFSVLPKTDVQDDNQLLFTYEGEIVLSNGQPLEYQEEMKGQSGCGIWLTELDGSGLVPPRLVGIFHHSSEKGGWVRGTSFRSILAKIREEYPGLSGIIDAVPDWGDLSE